MRKKKKDWMSLNSLESLQFRFFSFKMRLKSLKIDLKNENKQIKSLTLSKDQNENFLNFFSISIANSTHNKVVSFHLVVFILNFTWEICNQEAKISFTKLMKQKVDENFLYGKLLNSQQIKHKRENVEWRKHYAIN